MKNYEKIIDTTLSTIYILILIIFFAAGWCAMNNFNAYMKTAANQLPQVPKYEVVTIERCEYLLFKQSGTGEFVVTHKGNCKNH